MPVKTATKKKVATTAKSAPKKQTKSSAKPALKAVTKTTASKKPANSSVKPVKAAVKAPMKTTPAKSPVAKTAPKVAAPVAKKVKAEVVAPVKAAKNDNNNVTYEFKAGDKVVYPAHGVGLVEGIEKLTVAGTEVTLYTITFTKDRMRLKLPMQKVHASGLRRLADKDQLAEVYQTMKGRARIRRVMWSRRAQEYEAKINSGNPVQVAEVLRDLRRNVSSTEHSYSERQIFQQALERLASELAAIEDVGQDTAAEKLQTLLAEAA